MKHVRVATQNRGKLVEFKDMLEPLGFAVRGVDDLPDFAVDEDRDTFEGNAEKKARALLLRTGEAALADDSGLVVDALHGAPGVRSARYAGELGARQDEENRAKLRAALADVPEPERTARFVCALCYVEPGEPAHIFRGTLEGAIARDERGRGGFGYDPLFLLPERGLTLAELGAHDKHAISHRGQALRAFLAFLASR